MGSRVDRAGTGARGGRGGVIGGGDVCFFCSFAYFCAWLLSAWCEGGERRSLVGFLSSLELRSKMQVRDGDGACLTRPSLAGCQLCCIMDDLD